MEDLPMNTNERYELNKNLAQMTIENTAKLQGYKSLDEAESKLK